MPPVVQGSLYKCLCFVCLVSKIKQQAGLKFHLCLKPPASEIKALSDLPNNDIMTHLVGWSSSDRKVVRCSLHVDVSLSKTLNPKKLPICTVGV